MKINFQHLLKLFCQHFTLEHREIFNRRKIVIATFNFVVYFSDEHFLTFSGFFTLMSLIEL